MKIPAYNHVNTRIKYSIDECLSCMINIIVKERDRAVKSSPIKIETL